MPFGNPDDPPFPARSRHPIQVREPDGSHDRADESRSAIMNDVDATYDIDSGTEHDRIARIAYVHWEQRGRPHGSPEVDWYSAEEAVRRMRALQEDVTSSFNLGHETTRR